MVNYLRLLFCALAIIPMQSVPMSLSAQSRFALAKFEKCTRCAITDPQRFSGCDFKKILGYKNFHATLFKKNASLINGLKKEIYVSHFDDAVRALRKNQFSVDIHTLNKRLAFGSFKDCQGSVCHIFSTKINHINK